MAQRRTTAIAVVGVSLLAGVLTYLKQRGERAPEPAPYTPAAAPRRPPSVTVSFPEVPGVAESEREYRIDVEVVSARTGDRVVDPIDVRIDRYEGDSATTRTTGTAYGERPRRDGFVEFEPMHAGTYRLVCIDAEGKPLGPEVEVVCGGDATAVSAVLRIEGR